MNRGRKDPKVPPSANYIENRNNMFHTGKDVLSTSVTKHGNLTGLIPVRVDEKTIKFVKPKKPSW